MGMEYHYTTTIVAAVSRHLPPGLTTSRARVSSHRLQTDTQPGEQPFGFDRSIVVRAVSVIPAKVRRVVIEDTPKEAPRRLKCSV
ncbi:hypothetical protein TSAR_006500 [Trichomalopsis sarcophagae]|uniref:Uncharacterized protein n=1 Tax=Trichomalopsis sarcophagae TaxID=543379 RepID=A0A232F209_9HYME|nr:hypothetical protein TSAR_006500 [Trichomalopsis sarcophagae]